MSRSDASAGDLAIVLHTHMPYVEGFGTYPFGEEWLFDAVARSYLPVLSTASKVTMGVTPVLADQLEAPGLAERMEAFLALHRLGAQEREAAEGEPAPAEIRQSRGPLRHLHSRCGRGWVTRCSGVLNPVPSS